MKSKRCTCLQITYAAVRRAEMIWRGGNLECVHEDSLPLPAVDPMVSDPLSNPALEDTVGRLLCGIKRRRVFVSISSSEVLLRRIELPEAVPEAAAEVQRSAIKTVLENEDYIPVSLDSAAYDFHLMSAATLLVGWMRNGKLASLAEQFSEMVYLTPGPVTLANQLFSEGSKRVCGVHVDGEFCNLVVVEAGELCFGRSFFVGSPDQLGGAVQQNLDSCGVTLERIVLFGSVPESMCEQLSGQLGVEVTRTAFDWQTALMNTIRNGAGISLNLLAPALAERAAARRSKRKRLVKRMVPVAALLALLGANAWLYDAIESGRERIDALRRETARVKTLASKTKSLQGRYDTLEKPLAQLAWGERRFPTLADRFAHIADKRPSAVRLTEIKTVPPPRGAKALADFDARRVLILVGVAPAQKGIDAFRAALVTQSEFSSARQVKTEQITIAGERWLEFTLALESSGEWEKQ